MTDKRKRAHKKLAALPGVRSVRRPLTAESDDTFDLFYVRTGRPSANPLVIIPGGPGVASIQLYQGLRRRLGTDVLMIEHRGVGMSRHDDAGADLPPQALTVELVVDDVAAVLDDAGVDKAVVYGTSYGSYIAAGVGVAHPDRVSAMILDSPVLSADDIDAVREATRGVLSDGKDPETAELAPKVRKLVDDGVMTPEAGQLAAALYGFGGPALLRQLIDLLARGRRALWTMMSRVAVVLVARKAPYRNEPDLVNRIGFRELNYGAEPDGKPLDPAVAMREFADDVPDFEQEPYDLSTLMPTFTWPTVVISGGRDLITPPAIAERIASLIPNAVLVRLATAGHSVIDARERAAAEIVHAVLADDVDQLRGRGGELDRMPGSWAIRLLVSVLGVAAAVEAALPEMVPRAVARVATS